MNAAHLLPPNASPLEIALDSVDAARPRDNAARIASLWNADTCPVELLGYLAWQFSSDLWDDDWPEVKKRDVCRRAIDLHRSKTTPAGIRAHVEIAGGEVTAIRRPPGTVFLRSAISPEARAAWLADLPQIRIYPFVQRAVSRRRAFTGGEGRRGHLGALWLRSGRGRRLHSRRATYYDRGVERQVTLSGDVDGALDRVFIGATRPRAMFVGSGHIGGFVPRVAASANVVSILRTPGTADFPVRRGMEPVSIAPTRIAAGRIAPRSRAFVSRFGFLRASHAPLMMFDRIALIDPDRFPARRRVRSFWGHGRLGAPAFTATLRVAVPMQRQRRRAARWHGVGFLRGADMAPLDRVTAAVTASKAARDTLLIDTATAERARFRPGLRFGAFNFGERIMRND